MDWVFAVGISLLMSGDCSVATLGEGDETVIVGSPGVGGTVLLFVGTGVCVKWVAAASGVW